MIPISFKLRTICYLCILLFPFFKTYSFLEENIFVRIKMGSEKVVKISGENLKRTFLLTGNVRYLEGSKSITFYCDKFLQKNKISKKPFLVTSIQSTDISNIVIINSNQYHGTVFLLANPKKRKCDIILKTEFAGYLSSVLAKEMNAVWPIEALKAQAVAARTYALYKMKLNQNKAYDMSGDEKDQVIGHILDKTHKTNQAVMQTSGQVLLSPKGQLIPAFYHAECGGEIFKPGELWQTALPNYTHKRTIFCRKRKHRFEWKYKVSNIIFFKFIKWLSTTKKLKIQKITKKIKIYRDSFNKSFVRIKINNIFYVFKKSWFRRFLGRFKLRSNTYKVQIIKNRILVSGRGRGHGVGLCQLGALEMAKLKYNYKQILKYYFPKFKLSFLVK